MRVKLKLMVAGYCKQSEITSIKKGCWNIKKFPAIFALIIHPIFGYILFDTGYTQRFFSETKRFPFSLYRWITKVHIEKKECAINQLKNMGIPKEKINYILISHFHADHIGGLKDFPNAKFICFKSSYENLKEKKGFHALKKGFLSGLLPDDFENRIIDVEKKPILKLSKDYYPFTQAYDLFNDQSIIALNLPGHDKKQMGILLQNEANKNILLLGDASWSTKAFEKNLSPSFLSHLIHDDINIYKKTLLNLHILSRKNPQLLMIPSHCQKVWGAIQGGSL